MPYIVYITIKGQKQGQFAGDGSSKANKDRILVRRLSFSVSARDDAATGLPSGKRQYTPILIQKSWGAASLQVYEAMATNEVLPVVLIEFVTIRSVHSDPVKEEEDVLYSFTLTSARIASVKVSADGVQGTNELDDLEEISFVFEKIEAKDRDGKVFADDWPKPLG